MKHDINLTTAYALSAHPRRARCYKATVPNNDEIRFIAGWDEHVVNTKGGCASNFFALTTLAPETVRED